MDTASCPSGRRSSKPSVRLEDVDVGAKVAAALETLIVDEYQDVNLAQERLIELLAKPHGTADLVVVGDDDQSIYQWRGSDAKQHRLVCRTIYRSHQVQPRRQPTLAQESLISLMASRRPSPADSTKDGPTRPESGPAIVHCNWTRG